VSPGPIGTPVKMLSLWGFTLCFEELADSGLSLQRARPHALSLSHAD
jgi:hypothetical protein